MRFELAEIVVMASRSNLEDKAREAVATMREGRARVSLQCENTTVEVGPLDDPESLMRRWGIEHDFFGLPRRQRRMLFRACFEGQMTAAQAAGKVGVPAWVAELYAERKGWMIRG